MDSPITSQGVNAFVTAMAGLGGTTIIGVGAKLWKLAGRIERRLDQHDVMWECFCTEHNMPNISKLGKEG